MRRTLCTTALLAAGLVLACGDPVTAPTGTARHDVTTADEAALIPNSVKYRDAGHRPATGRAGGATITTRALLGHDGTTLLEVYAGELGGTGPGELQQVQVKTFDADGAHQGTRVEHPRGGRTLVVPLYGLWHDRAIQVQALVRGASGPRTGVVTVRDLVKWRPDLAVVSIDAPARTWIHTPTFLSAVVRELNGDVGARATCVLDVGGTPVDSAEGIWVDAGGTVSCAFAHQFTTPGEQAIRVRVTGADPSDDDPTNDAATATVLVMVEVPMSHGARAASTSDTDHRKTTYDFTTMGIPGGGFKVHLSDTYDNSFVSQSSSLDAWTAQPLAFPEQPLTDVRLSQSTGGSTVHSATWASLSADSAVITPDSSRGCVSRLTSGDVVTAFTLCTRRVGGSSYSSVAYRWNAGDVSYRSINERRYFCSAPYVCPSDYYNNYESHSPTGTVVTLGQTFDFDVAFMSGAYHFTAAPAIPLQYSTQVYGSGPTCTTSVGPGPYDAAGRQAIGWNQWCSESLHTTQTVSGSASQGAP